MNHVICLYLKLEIILSKHILTIGLITYNGAKTLRNTLDYIDDLLNSNNKFYCCISDDASTDDTSKILKDFKIKNPSQVSLYIQKKNIGILENYKFVLDKSETEYFSWLSQDDFHEINWFKTLIDELENKKSSNCAIGDIKAISLTSRSNIKLSDYDLNPAPWLFKRWPNDLHRLLFFLTPGPLGKANFLYSLFRLRYLKRKLIMTFDMLTGNGYSDYAFDSLLSYYIIPGSNIIFNRSVKMFKYMNISTTGNFISQRPEFKSKSFILTKIKIIKQEVLLKRHLMFTPNHLKIFLITLSPLSVAINVIYLCYKKLFFTISNFLK